MQPEVMEAGRARLQAGYVDQFGVQGLQLMVAGDGQAWCLSEGPNADAVCKSHEALGIPIDKGTVTEVMTVV